LDRVKKNIPPKNPRKLVCVCVTNRIFEAERNHLRAGPRRDLPLPEAWKVCVLLSLCHKLAHARLAFLAINRHALFSKYSQNGNAHG
jgi:hypothetical protein